MNDHRGLFHSFGRCLELPDVYLGSEDGCALTSLLLGVLLLGSQAMLPISLETSLSPPTSAPASTLEEPRSIR